MGNLILDRWRSVVRERRDDAAIRDAAGGTLRTFGEIEREAERLLRELPDVSGRVVLIRVGNHASFPAVLVALARVGAIPLPLEPDVSGGGLREAREVTSAVGEVVVDGREVTYRATEVVPGANAIPSADFLKLSSGTTGAPKAIRFRWSQIVADCEAVCGGMGIGAGDVNFGLISVAHSYGFSNLVTPLLLCGVPLVLPGALMPGSVAEAIRVSGATVFPGIPKWFDLLSRERTDFGSLRICISAGAPLAPSVAGAFREASGVGIHSFYGASECGGICYDPVGDREVAGFVGRPLPGVQLIAREEERGVGALFTVRGPAVAEGYWPDRGSDELGDSEYRPGDLLVREAGGFRIVGRVSDFINVAGRKLNPSDLEGVISRFPGVREVVAFGVSDADRGEQPAAWVVGVREVDAEAVRRFCGEHLPAWQVPRRVRVVGEIPRNKRGKISRAELRRREEELQG